MITELLRGLGFAFRLAWRGGPAYLAVAIALSIFAGLLPPAQLYLLGVVVTKFSSGAEWSSLVAPAIGIGCLMGLLVGVNSIMSIGVVRVRRASSVQAVQELLEAMSSFELIAMEDSAFRDDLEIAKDTAEERLSRYWEILLEWFSRVVCTVGVLVVLAQISLTVAGLLLLAALPPAMFTRWIFRAWDSVARNSASPSRRREVLMQSIISPAGFMDVSVSRSWRSTGKTAVALHRRFWKFQTRGYDVEAVAVLGSAFMTAGLLAICILWLARNDASAGDVAVVLGSLSSLSVLLNVFFGIATLAAESPYLRVLQKLTESRQRLGHQIDTAEAGGGIRSIELSNVSFRYPSQDFDVLRGVDLRLTPGRIYAIVGENGSGKSTLCKILMGLYYPSGGCVLVDGKNWAGITVHQRAMRIAFMSQDIPKRPVSLRSYLSCDRQLTDTDLFAYLQSASAAETVRLLPSGLDTVIGAEFEGGAQFSGGQWQRLALARLMAAESPVWILDEPSAALDQGSEVILFDLLRSQAANRIVIVVSHRLNGLSTSDRIISVVNGVASEPQPYGTGAVPNSVPENLT